MSRQIIVAENAGFCFGVKRAVDMTVEYNNKNNTRVYTLGPLRAGRIPNKGGRAFKITAR